MDTASISPSHASSAKPSRRAPRRRGRTALRWIAGVSVFALLAATGFGVANAFADMAREDALAGAYREASADAARAAGGNPGPDWVTLLDAPAGRRSLALWFDTMRSQWPSACAERMAQVSQSSAACLPDSGLLQALIEARLGRASFDLLAQNAAANALERSAPGRPAAQTLADDMTATPDTPVRRAAEALREDEAEPSAVAFPAAIEPPPVATESPLPPTETIASPPEFNPEGAPLETTPTPEAPFNSDAALPPEAAAPAEAQLRELAGPTLNADEPIAANPSAHLGGPVLTAATLALVTP